MEKIAVVMLQDTDSGISHSHFPGWLFELIVYPILILFRTTILVRPGNAPIEEGQCFNTATDFNSLSELQC